jgi:hypothetical protein
MPLDYDEVWINTISGIKPGRPLTQADRNILGRIYDTARSSYKETPMSFVSGVTKNVWDYGHKAAYSEAFHSALRSLHPHERCKRDENCTADETHRMVGKCGPPQSPFGDLAVIHRVVPAEDFVRMITKNASLDHAYDLHQIRPSKRATSWGGTRTNASNASSGARTVNCGSGSMTLPAGMHIFGSGTL